MYGVPSDLDLTRFLRTHVIELGIGEHQLQVILQPDAGVSGTFQYIGIEGRWEVRDAAGALVDEAQEHAARDAYRVHRILGRRVTGGSLDAPRSFALRFDDGHELRVFDDSEQYESFSIQPGDIFV